MRGEVCAYIASVLPPTVEKYPNQIQNLSTETKKSAVNVRCKHNIVQYNDTKSTQPAILSTRNWPKNTTNPRIGRYKCLPGRHLYWPIRGLAVFFGQFRVDNIVLVILKYGRTIVKIKTSSMEALKDPQEQIQVAY